MEQAGNQLINTLISRQKLLENDVSFVKREQCAHSNQIETLAIEVHEMREDLGGKISVLTWNYNKMRGDMHEIKKNVKLILDALAIKT